MSSPELTEPRPPSADVDPASEFTTIPGAFPIALLPVRIETRFFLGQLVRNELRVRIYPDEFAADVHEPALTPTEISAAQDYWKQAWNAADEPDAWRVLVARYRAPRAAWIVLQATPSNLSTRPAGTPTFPAVPQQPQRWTRAAHATVLPDRWIAAAYRGGREIRRAVGSAIRDPLALTINPSVDTGDPDQMAEVSGDGLSVDTESAWTVDFNRAEQFGMAVRIPLSADDVPVGFDRLLVVGVKASLSPADSAKRLEKLMDAHHYTRGFAFLRQGTPTNNSSDARSGYPPPDPGGQNSFAVERGPDLNAPGSSGFLFTTALGIDPKITAHIDGAGANEQDAARAMNDVLWPSTFGYFLEHVMEPVFSASAITEARRFFVDHVRGRGSLPAFRVGATPYALLPVSSMERWASIAGALPVESQLAPFLRTLRPIWLQAAVDVPRVGRTGEPDTDLLEVLGMDASTRETRIRQVIGPELQVNLSALLGIDFTPWFEVHKTIAASILGTIGHPEWNPRIAAMSFGDLAFPFRHPLVTSVPPSEEQGLNPNYINSLRLSNSIANLRSQLPSSPPLLFLMLRHSALLEYARIAADLLISKGALSPALRRDFEFIAVGAAAQSRQTVWQRFDQKIANVTGTKTVGDYLLTSPANPDAEGVEKFRASLAVLENLLTAELERVFTETLDCCSHRLDAWINALPASRLAIQRVQNPLGVNLGAYGWVEDLRPAPAGNLQTIQVPGVGAVSAQPASGGFVHAPSISHAAAAAVLRNGYLTRSGDARARYAVDLSSSRVRAALVVLDGVREGQPLGAIFGYQFERGLHEGHAPLQLDKYIDPIRNLYPLIANKTVDSGQPAETVAARNVVDGLRLRAEWLAGTIPFGSKGLPGNLQNGNPTPDRAAIEQELRKLDDTADGLADLLLGESVYQIVKGNMAAAVANLDAIGQGMRPPSPEIAEQPRGGTSLTHRVGVVLGGDPIGAGPWTSIPATPRSTAEPFLDHWVGTLVGDPQNFRARASYPDPRPGDPTHRSQVEVKLSALLIRPLDILALAQAATSQGQASELDQRIAWVVLDTAPALASVQIDYTADPAWDRTTIRTLPELIEIAQSINAVLGSSRPLRPADLLTPQNARQASSADLLPAEAAQRSSAALKALNAANAALAAALTAIEQAPPSATPDLMALRNALLRISLFGLPSAVPASRRGSTVAQRAALLDQGHTVHAAATLRAGQAAAVSDPVAVVRNVFGRDFLLLPRFRPAVSSELDQALAYGPVLTGGDDAVRKWFQQAIPAHAPLGRWRKMALYARAMKGSALTFEVAQLPHDPNARWVALPFNGESNRPRSGRLSLALHRASAPAVTAPWVGLVLHEWSEIIPSVSEQTAVSFHYDDPGAEAPQTILLAVSPTGAATWDFDTVAAILNETLDLAKIRGVDSQLLGQLGQLLPAVFVAENAADDTIGVNFSQLRVGEPHIVGP